MPNKKQNHFLHWALILGFMLTSVLTVQYTTNMKASLLSTPQSAPFDGTVYPVQSIPDWTAISDQTINYYDCTSLIDMPTYDTSVLLSSTDGLKWGTQAYKDIVNAQITYPVVYAGNYELDHIEGAGSHPAVDIKALVDTPVYAIANGIVTKASYGSSGFGNSIVVAHYDVPNLDNPNIKTDIHSSYSHLSEILVAEGDVVEKGQLIGKVGSTGTATTNHLHFQIDNEDAPWNPYWPFTYAEYSALGYSFWDAIDNGLGAENVYAYTIHPMEYVNEYLDYAVSSDAVSNEDVSSEEVISEEPVVSDEDEVNDEEVQTPAPDTTRDFAEIEVQNDSYVLLNNNLSIYLTLKDDDDNVLSNPNFDGSIQISSSDGSVGSLSISHLESNDFNKGYNQFTFSPSKVGSTTVTLSFDNYEVETDISVIGKVEMANSFSVEHDGYFVIGVPEEITIKALDINGNFTPSYNVSGSVNLSLVSGGGDFYPDVIAKDDFKYGTTTVLFTATSGDDVLIKAKNGAIVGTSKVLKGELFSDLDDEYVYYKSIKYLRETGVINGYPDGTFKADQTVSRVETLKMIFEALDANLEDGADLSFSDVDISQWYADYVATAETVGIVNGYPDGTFRPADPVNKVELVKMLLNAADISIDPVVIGDPYNDVDNLDWFAPYVNYVKGANMVPVDGSVFEPDHDMTRGEVAETIYRLLAVQHNNVAQYSVLLSI